MPFAKPPYLFLTVQTDNDATAVSVRARNVTTDGFEAALFEEEALLDGSRPSEIVGYLAIDSSAGGGVIDLDGRQVPYLLQHLDADDRWSPVLSQRLKVEEEQSLDDEVGHVDETLDVLALGKQLLAQQVSNNDGDTTALRRLEPSEDALMEWGFVRDINHNWQTLPFAKTYIDPVLIAKPASINGGQPGVIRLKEVAATSAQLRYQEWSYLDGSHTGEDIFYMVSEAGIQALGGLTVEAGRVTTNRLGRKGQWEPIKFDAVFMGDARPVVFASVMTNTENETVTTRIDALDVFGLDLSMDEQEDKDDGHLEEILGWIAIEEGSGITAEGRNIDVFFAPQPVDHVLTTVLFPNATGHRHPTVLSDINSTNGRDPVSLRYANPSSTQIELKLAEEQSADNETAHTGEDGGIFVGE